MLITISSLMLNSKLILINVTIAFDSNGGQIGGQ